MTRSFPKTAFIGVGRMAETIVGRALKTGWPRANLLLTHRRADRRAELAERFGGPIDADNKRAARDSDIVLLAVRPQDVADVLADLVPALRPGQTVVSIAAGLTIPWLKSKLPAGVAAIRVTPPPTAGIAAGVALFAADDLAPAATRLTIETLFAGASERVEWIDDALIEPVTGVAMGLTPYLCKMLQVLIAAGVEQGVEPAFCRRMVMDGLAATARLLAESGATPEAVIEHSMTRGGLTWSALRTMDERGFSDALRAGARAMTGRSYELRGEAAPPDYQGFAR